MNWNQFPEKVALQMNDTHPTLCIPALIRILMDVKGLKWNEAWEITQRHVCFISELFHVFLESSALILLICVRDFY